MNAEQVENTRMAYAIIAGVPARRVELDLVRATRGNGPSHIDDEEMCSVSCNTVGCIAGWLSAHPYFQARGLRFERGIVRLNRNWSLTYASDVLFDEYEIFDGGKAGIAGKREALARLRGHLYRNGAITAARNAQLQLQEKAMQS